MPSFCGVVGCGSRSERDNVSFFRLPSAFEVGRSREKTANEKRLRRRNAWINALHREDLTETKLKYLRICSKHFINGKPASLDDVDHPDWIPTVNMGYETHCADLGRYSWAKKRKEVGTCCALNCNHREMREACKFFRFPKDKKLLKIWSDLCGRSHLVPKDHWRLCSCHFVDGKKENNPTIFSRERNSKPTRNKVAPKKTWPTVVVNFQPSNERNENYIKDHTQKITQEEPAQEITQEEPTLQNRTKPCTPDKIHKNYERALRILKGIKKKEEDLRVKRQRKLMEFDEMLHMQLLEEAKFKRLIAERQLEVFKLEKAKLELEIFKLQVNSK